MRLSWVHESPPYWDAGKVEVVGGAPAGIFRVEQYASGALLPGDWWRVEDDGSVVGYGWMDHTWGDAEILLAVAAGQQGRGIGAFILDHLEDEAAAQGLNYLYNVVPTTRPDRARLVRWLEARGFAQSHDADLWRRRVLPKPVADR